MSSTSALRHVFVGGYTTEADGHATGVTSLLNENSAKRVRLKTASLMELTSPTWLARHPTLPVLLATGEATPGTVSSLRWDDDGTLTLLSTVETAGDGACHVAMTSDGRYAIVSSYRSGLISVVGVNSNGTLTPVVDSVQFAGSGPVTDRQEGPHAHQVVFVDDEILSCDLGSDQIYRLRLEEGGALIPSGDPIRLPPGSGPRHLVAVEDHLVVACELSGELWLGARDGDGWQQAQILTTSTRSGLNQPSGIAVAGTRVYVANRGVDTIGVFDLDPAISELTPVAEFDCGGTWPRDVTVDGGLLWVSNERSDTVTVFEISLAPPPGPVAELTQPTPTCVVLVHDGDAADDGVVPGT
ncbi:MAG TPA: beta-propeller fold lactonase family protein [Microlunatus sp.]|nr:beta-propeller fold lactonase family protein [Microlunatus sp.]